MSAEAHELLRSDMMRMAELLQILQNSIPPVSVIAEKTGGRMGPEPREVRIQQAEKEITETLEIARNIYGRVRAATDPRVELVKCVGVFRDSEGTGLYHAIVLCTKDEFDEGHHYDMMRESGEENRYDVATGDPVVDECDDAFSGFSTFEWSTISPRDWLVSAEVKSIFLL